ncbi:MAG: FAD-dependent oxidoreductase [Abditibacteriota bacterium]|nr:FAD-dependent oxidoreductase [Abditibacteriota bacterium]
MNKTLIIGGVAAGASCAARLRRLDEKREIIILERGKYISYANCGLPYHIGDVIPRRGSLILMTPEVMKARFRIDARTENEALSIDRGAKCVTVRNHKTGEEYRESYDTLVLATGSSPLRPPVPGIDSPKIRTLWTVPDAEEIRAEVRSGALNSALVIGGGFIGLETAENLCRAGLKVTLAEAADQVMAPLDYEMAQLLHENLRDNGVDLRLGDGVERFEDSGKGITAFLQSGAAVTADTALLAIGVRPNSGLAREAGLELNGRGGIITDDRFRTSDPHIYAIGDAAETRDFVFGSPAMIPLAGPANKQGRILANILAGIEDRYGGTQGSSIARVFDLTAASTGANEKTLVKRGLEKGKDYESVIIIQNSHASYYPGAKPLVLKLLFAPDSGRLFGAQTVGYDGADKRIDTIATALRLGAVARDLSDMELAYAPPFSSAKDPVNMAGFAAENVMAGLLRFAEPGVHEKHPSATLLDVREDAERAAFTVPGSIHVPLGSLRERLDELDRNREYVIFCGVGVRAWTAMRIMAQNGFENLRVYPGGVRFYRSYYHKPGKAPESAPAAPGAPEAPTAQSAPSVSLDCTGLQCPGPITEIFRAISGMKEGETLEVTASDPGFVKDIGPWCRSTGNTLLESGGRNGGYYAVIRRGTASGQENPPAEKKGKTIVVFDGDMDKVLAAFVIANGALAMGRPVTMFFTFWGLTALRRKESVPVKKDLMGKLFGFMLPRGAAKLGLSKMDMGGLGRAMMKRIMKDKNVDPLEEMMKKAMDGGAKIIACSMSMDVMGIKPEELIDGVETGGVGAYLGAAEEADTNLFI